MMADRLSVLFFLLLVACIAGKACVTLGGEVCAAYEGP